MINTRISSAGATLPGGHELPGPSLVSCLPALCRVDMVSGGVLPFWKFILPDMPRQGAPENRDVFAEDANAYV